jgi:hypothetical protein
MSIYVQIRNLDLEQAIRLPLRSPRGLTGPCHKNFHERATPLDRHRRSRLA